MIIDNMDLKPLILTIDQVVKFRIGLEPLVQKFHLVNNEKIKCTKLSNKKCELCESAMILWKHAADYEVQNAAKKLFAINRYFYHVQIEKNKYKIKVGDYYWECGKIIYKALNQLIMDCEKYILCDKKGNVKPVYFTYKKSCISTNCMMKFYTYDDSYFTIGKNIFKVKNLIRDAEQGLLCNIYKNS